MKASGIALGVDLFRFRDMLAADEAFVLAVLEALTAHNAADIRRRLEAGAALPWLYTPGVVTYREEPPGVETFPGFGRLLEQGYGDCAPLCAARAAERRVREGDAAARCVLKRQVQAGRLRGQHVVVLRGDGVEEDASRMVGM